jgi:hypothetical protein
MQNIVRVGHVGDRRAEELDADQPAARARAAHADRVALAATATPAQEVPCRWPPSGLGSSSGGSYVVVAAGGPVREQVGVPLLDALVEHGDANRSGTPSESLPCTVFHAAFDVDVRPRRGALVDVAVEVPLQCVM